MKNKPFDIGKFMVASPVPEWICAIGLLPLAISPILCIAGVIHGRMKIKQEGAWCDILRSVIGLAENFLLLYGMLYIGSKF